MGLFDKLFGVEKTKSSSLREALKKEVEKSKQSNSIGPERNIDNAIKTTNVQDNDENKRHEIVMSNFDEFVIDDKNTNVCEEGYDEYFIEAGRFIIEKKRAAIGMLQHRFRIGFRRAARIMDQLFDAGVVGPETGDQPREIIMTLEGFEKFVADNSISEKTASQVKKEYNSTDQFVEQILNEFNALSSKQQSESPDTLAAELLRTKFKKTSDFSADNVKMVVEQGNTIVPNCEYDAVLDFMETLLGRCSANDLQLLLIDTDGIFNLYNGFPNLLHPVVTDNKKVIVTINWLSNELKTRQRHFISEGVRDYLAFLKISIDKDNRKFPFIMLIIREMQAIINDYQVLDALEFILRNGPRNGIFVLGFTAYDLRFIKLGKIKTFFHIANDKQILHIFDTSVKTEESIDFAKMDRMSGVDFENFCTSILEKKGFTQIHTTKTSGDYGGDIVATKDQIKYVIQCKRYSSSIGVSAVQEVIAARSIYKCHVGVVLTNNYFTPAALKLAESNNILLWNRDDLLAMMQS